MTAVLDLVKRQMHDLKADDSVEDNLESRRAYVELRVEQLLFAFKAIMKADTLARTIAFTASTPSDPDPDGILEDMLRVWVAAVERQCKTAAELKAD